MLWDLGLKVGHATRSVDECVRLARSDMTIRTAVLEARYIWGDEGLFKTLVSRVDGVERQAAPWPDWAITTCIDTMAHWPTVWRAVRCHESQMATYGRLAELSEDDHRRLWGTQEFYRAMSLVNGGRARENDLFAGLR